MIIEIKDLPTDRKVKHITFDITFEEDGTAIVKQVPIPQVPVPFVPPVDPMQPPWTVTSSVATDNVPLASDNTRVAKDIPPEMRDMEF